METMQIIWFFIWGILWAIFFITDGYDFGVSIVALTGYKDKQEKEAALSTINPFWNANEVWLILAGGVTFAAFPKLYAVMFSSFYMVLSIILFAVIIRGVSIEFRHQSENVSWLKFWERLLLLSSLSIAFFLGILFANIFKGIAIDASGIYQDDFLSFFNLYAILSGIAFLVIFILHGTLWIGVQTKDNIKKSAIDKANLIWFILLIGAVVFLIVSYYQTKLYDNYFANKILLVVPVLACISLLLIKYYLIKKNALKAFICSSFFIFFLVMFGIIGLYPNMLPSTIDPAYSIDLRDSSSFATLKLMLGLVIIILPCILLYQSWSLKLFKNHGEKYGE